MAWRPGPHLVVDHAFDELGYTRIEARVPVDRIDDIRAGSIGGLRREGILRGAGDDPDRALLARLAGDPPATSREGFIALLNAGLPTKRVIAQGRLRDENGRILLCRLTYKREWDLPAGSSRSARLRPPGWRARSRRSSASRSRSATCSPSTGCPRGAAGTTPASSCSTSAQVDASFTGEMQLQPTEIVGVEWCDADAVREHAAAAAAELLAAVDAGDLPVYREAPLAPD